MNRDERSEIMMLTRQFLSTVGEQCSIYRDFLEETVQKEAAKLENLPLSLWDSDNSTRITESIEALESAIETIEESSTSLEQLPELLNIRIRKPRQKIISEKPQITEPCEIHRASEKRTERLQLVVTPSLAAALKHQSGQMRISTNELVNRILLQSLNPID